MDGAAIDHAGVVPGTSNPNEIDFQTLDARVA